MGVCAFKVDATQHFGGSFLPGRAGFVFDGKINVFVVAEPHQVKIAFGGLRTIAQLQVGLFEEVGVFGEEREREGK